MVTDVPLRKVATVATLGAMGLGLFAGCVYGLIVWTLEGDDHDAG